MVRFEMLQISTMLKS